ncbi:MAG: TonB-dependent receptor [bacterium]|nr:TonB-dependent receptor [bacterium]
MRQLLILFLSVSWAVPILAQPDTAVILPAAEITTSPLRANFTGSQEQRWDSTDINRYAGHYLTDLLEREGGIFIKNYGGGSIATTSIRGGSAGHTAVTWNGLPLQSPMLGQLDFSLLPLAFVDAVNLQRGGGSAAWGSGAIGGTVGLRNTPLSYRGIEAGAQTVLGSFGFQDHQARARYRGEQWAFNTRLFRRSANNDFGYQLDSGEERQQTHADFRQQGIMQEVYWQPRPDRQLAVFAWWQTSDRNIPPLTTQTRSEALQLDTFLRTALHYQQLSKRGVFNARLGWFREAIDYRDDATLLRALSHFHTLMAEVEQQWALSADTELQAGLFYNWATAAADGYRGERPEQQRAAAFASLRKEWDALRVQLSLRKELVDDHWVPIVPALGANGPITSNLSWQAKISRNYRIPTLNDLYWLPGGNPDLLPEIGWSAEGGLTWRKGVWSYSMTGFHRRIEDWIMWGITEGQNFWSANNLTEVWSRGLEQRLSCSFATGEWQWEGQVGYDYIRSTNEIAIQQPQLSEGEQLAYTPEHLGFARVTVSKDALQFTYQHRLTSAVQTLNDTELPGYHLGFAQLQYELDWQKFTLQAFGRADNLWDASYRIVDRRPMPGRSFQLGINLFFKHNH